MLEVEVEKRLGDFVLHAAFAAEGGVTALFGASGAGKTSVINMVAGLLKPDRGRIAIGSEPVFDSARGINAPPSKRRIGYVFQEGRLFPHLSVRHNLDYGRWMSGHAFDTAAFDRVVEMLDIARIVDRRPGKLSGGERQRVAVGRALLMKPRLLLLDEPLASLDTARKAEILPYLERLRDEAEMPMIYVSHSAEEVRRLATHIVTMDGGRVTATGGVELLSGVMPREGGASSNPGLA